PATPGAIDDAGGRGEQFYSRTTVRPDSLSSVAGMTLRGRSSHSCGVNPKADMARKTLTGNSFSTSPTGPKRVTATIVLAGALITGTDLFAQEPARADRHGDPLPPGAVARLGTVRLRTTATAFVLTPDGKTILTVSGGRTLGSWDPETGRLREEIHLPGPHAE